jgi:small neutral amino acid transporter SnatA (MarC family)
MLLANVWQAASALQALAKVMGLMLTAIAVQMLVDGLVSVFPFLSQAAF